MISGAKITSASRASAIAAETQISNLSQWFLLFIARYHDAEDARTSS